jgi:DNA-binding transcriptional LysR family regulator
MNLMQTRNLSAKLASNQDMLWDDLEIFIAVAESGSFTRASERLGRPKSSVSRAVSLLEQSLGERLMERSSRSLRLTDAGTELLRRASPLYSELRSILAERASFHGKPRGVLRIAATYEFATHSLVDILPAVLTEYPDISATVDMLIESPHPIADGYDIVFWQSITPLPDSSVIARRLFDVGFGLYASPALIDENGTPATIDDLRSWSTVTTKSHQIWTFSHAGSGTIHELQTHARLVATSAEFRLRATENGSGIAVLPMTMCEEAVRQRRLVRVLPEYIPAPLTVYALMPSRKMLAPRTQVLLDAIKHRFDSSTPRADCHDGFGQID